MMIITIMIYSPHHQTKLAIFLHELVQLDSHLDNHRYEFLDEIRHSVTMYDSTAKEMTHFSTTSRAPLRIFNDQRDALEWAAMESINRQRDLGHEFQQLQIQVNAELSDADDAANDDGDVADNDNDSEHEENQDESRQRTRMLLDKMEKIINEKEIQGQRFERLVTALASLDVITRPTNATLYSAYGEKMIGSMNQIKHLWESVEGIDVRRGQIDDAISKAVLDLILMSRYDIDDRS